jgi:3-oxoacyl-[acyl-carrier protein] reductase
VAWTWDDEVVVITGATRGIGRAVVAAVAERGARVGLIARGEADLTATLQAVGGRGAVAPADVGDRAQLEAALASLEAELGPIGVLVANAGIGAYGPYADVDPDEVDRLVRVNLLGTMHAVRAVVPGMIARRHGHIVTIGSIAGRIGAPFEATYSATKFGVVGFTEALAVELSPYDVGVSMVNPGPVDTDFFEARGHTYDRSRPKPVKATAVAADVVAAVERDRLERVIPRSLGAAVVVRHVAPWLMRSGTRLTFRKELAADVRSRPRTPPAAPR